MPKTKLGEQVFKKGDRVRLKLNLNPNNLTGTVRDGGIEIIEVKLDNGIEFIVFGDEIEKIGDKKGRKKRGCKGRVEVWSADGGSIATYKTVQEAIDSIPLKKSGGKDAKVPKNPLKKYQKKRMSIKQNLKLGGTKKCT